MNEILLEARKFSRGTIGELKFIDTVLKGWSELTEAEKKKIAGAIGGLYEAEGE